MVSYQRALRARRRRLARSHQGAASRRRSYRSARTPRAGTLLFTSGETRRRWKPRTMAQYRSIHRRVVASFGAMPLASIRPRHVAAYIDATSKQSGLASVGRDVDLLHAIFKTARREELVDANPADGAERPRFPPFRPQNPRAGRGSAGRKGARCRVERVVFLTLVLTGLRRSELQRPPLARRRPRRQPAARAGLEERGRILLGCPLDHAGRGALAAPALDGIPRGRRARLLPSGAWNDVQGRDVQKCADGRSRDSRCEQAAAGVPRPTTHRDHERRSRRARAHRRHDEGRPLGHEDDQAVHASRRRRLPRRGGCTGAAAPRSCYSNCYSRRRSSRGTSPRGRRGWTQFDCVDALGRTSSSSRPFLRLVARDTCASDQGGGGLNNGCRDRRGGQDELVGRLFGATVGAMDLFGVYLGDRLGLYRALAERGPLTSGGLAGAAGVHERHAREWLEQQAASAILGVDDPAPPHDARRYSLPPGHDEALLDEDSLNYAAPFARLIVAAGRPIEARRRPSGTAAGCRTPSTGSTSTRRRRPSPGRSSANCSAQSGCRRSPDVHARLSPILRRRSRTLPAAAGLEHRHCPGLPESARGRDRSRRGLD